MDADEPSTPAFRFGDSRQKRIHERLLRLVSSGSAAFFRDACRLADSQVVFESTTHLVGHLLREVESSIRYAFQPLIRSTGAIQPRNGDERHRFEIEQALTALGVPLVDPAAKAWLALAGRGNVRGLHALAHRRDLGPPRPFDVVARESFELTITALDTVLEKVEERWEVVLAAFDTLAAKSAPTSSDAEELRLRLPNSLQVRAHFFGRLMTAAWIQPLADQGFFRQPPEPTRDDEAGTIGFAPWPESQYLLRIVEGCAHQHDEQIVAIAEQIPNSENVRVYDDLAALALAVLPALAVRLLPQVRHGLSLPYLSLLPYRVADLSVHLASGGVEAEALALARALLSLRPDPRSERYADGEERLSPPQPRTLMHEASYDEILGKVVSGLHSRVPEDTVGLLCDLLEEALRLSQKTSRQTGPEAHSQVWWPKLTDPGPRHAEPPWLLLGQLRNLALATAQHDSAHVLDLVEKLERRSWHAFRRLALLLLCVVPGVPIEAIEARLLRLSDHEELELHAEYVALLKATYPSLSPGAQATIAEYLSREWEPEQATENFRFWKGREPTPEELQLRRDHWRNSRMEPISEHLPSDLKEIYDRTAKTEPAQTETLPFGWWSERSPKSSEEIRQMGDDELVDYLYHVELGDERFGPSREGLGSAWAASVAAEPERFAKMAPRLHDLDPAYQYGLLSGFQESVRSRKPFDWELVLELSFAAATRPRTLPDESERRHHNPDQGWARRAVVDLLAEGLKEGPAEIPYALRERVWSALVPVTDDPEPNAADDLACNDEEARVGLLLNSIRGRAFDAVWAYVVWVYRHGHAPRAESMTFERIPEVREVLEAHLNPGHDPSAAIRVFYGMKLSQLRRLDSGWVRQQLPKIIPDDPTQLQLRASAWRAYLRFTEVLPPDLELLRPYYDQAVRGLTTASLEADERKAAEQLGAHLVRLQWLGALAADESEGLLPRFFGGADGELRGETIAFVGHVLHNTKDRIPEEILARMRGLWTWRRATAERAADPRLFARELAAFGWWFVTIHLEPQWALDELHAALRLSPRTEISTLVVKKLEGLSPQYPRTSLDCLALIVEGKDPHFGPDFWLQHVRPILVSALRCPDGETRQATVDLINRLSALGHTQFRDLL